MTTKELYTKGARVWIPHPERVWEGGTLAADYHAPTLLVTLDSSGETRTIQIKNESEMPPLQNPSILIGQNDLTSLSYLHEPAVLHNLRVRFCERNAIYTYCGIVLVAINPYYELPIYGDETIMAYRGQAMGDLDPHIFAVSEEAYTKLERENRNQSIIVSGESGAGKTVSAKYAMRYMAAVGGSSSETQVERKVLASSPILEALGNAKTTRNDNSSRFGKFIEIHFDKQRRISGASIRTYLLERSRVVYQSTKERNYHAFYQLRAAAKEFPEFELDQPEEFEYLSRGGCCRIDGVDDLHTFRETCAALATLGVSDTKHIWAVLAAILHLGDVRLDASLEGGEGEDEGEQHSGAALAHVSESDAHAGAAARLLGVPRAVLARWLAHRRIVSATEVIEARMDQSRANASRDALAKRLYGAAFAWMVAAINRALHNNTEHAQFIGVLDIYGFETFETNSFEQFCINYANEKLQQQFNWHVFKLEQEEYIREGISWEMISFEDNQPCIDLIEGRLGVLALLDEQCRVQGSDGSFVKQLLEHCAKQAHFVKPRFGGSAFSIRHFADIVEYQAEGFVEKNRDAVSEEQVECIRTSSTVRLVRDMLGEPQSNGASGDERATLPPPRRRAPAVALHALTQPPRRATGRATVGHQFRQSLAALATTLSATTPHYVRCIKPNDTKQPFQFDAARAVHQLRACGVLETIRISAAGFPSRWLYQDFFQRYRLLVPAREVDRGDARGSCGRIVRRHLRDEDQFQFGATKLFFRAGQLAYLERLRAHKQRASCVKVQACVRGFLARRRYQRIRRAVCGLQARARGLLARRKADAIRRHRAAVTLQRHVRGWIQRTRYQRLRKLVIGLQSRARGMLARRLYEDRRKVLAVIAIQRYARGYLARLRATMLRKRIVIVQACVRGFLARRQYKRLRIEARSLDHVKTLNKGLENKIISLQQRLGDALERAKLCDVLQGQLAEHKVRLEKLKPLESEVKSLRSILGNKDSELAALREELQKERDANSLLAQQKTASEKALLQQLQQIKSERDDLQEQLVKDREHYEMQLEERSRTAQRELSAALGELEAERSARQKLLSAQCDLQEQLDTLQSGTEQRTHRRSLSDASAQSQADVTTEDDFGYGSVRSSGTTAARPALEAVNWAPAAGDAHGPHTDHAPLADAGLVLRMQTRLATLHADLTRAQQKADDLEDRLLSGVSSATGAYSDRFRVEELEIENKRLKEHLHSLCAARDGDQHNYENELLKQVTTLQHELERRREECIQLKSMLSNQTVNLKSLASSNYGSDVDIINEDGELASAYETQKGVNRQLQQELAAIREQREQNEQRLKQDLALLREQNDSYVKLLSAELGQDQTTKLQKFAQNEINRLAAENLALQERVDKLSESCRLYKRQVALLADELRAPSRDLQHILDSTEMPSVLADVSAAGAVTRKKEREYLGMFEYKLADEQLIIKRLIIDLKPRVAVTLLPGLPAFILFMMLRHMDHVDDEPKMHRLMRAVRAGVKKTLKRKSDSAEHAALWLSNLLRLLNTLRQYSGDAAFQLHNTPKQNQQALRVFDLTEYRQVLSDTAVWIYQGLVTLLERSLERLIVPAVLEHEEISELSGAGRGSGPSGQPGPARLKQELSTALSTLRTFHVDPPLIVALFKQLFYYICAYSLNQLLLRKDLCCWAKGLQIRYNISHLENWIKENLIEYGQPNVEEVLGVLRPVTQAVQLLQARKSMDDVQSTVDMCANLNAMQVCKILNMYTPEEEYELKVTREFIHETQKKMQERAALHGDKEPQNLLMDSKMIFSVKFPFNPSPVRLEDIEVPEVLGLDGLLTKI